MLIKWLFGGWQTTTFFWGESKLGIVGRKGKGGDCEAGIYFSRRDTDRIKSGTT